jgi:group I intron endonuclease
MTPYGYIYITTNLINGKQYIGQSSYSRKKGGPGYLGSGRNIQKAVRKYGHANFRKEILFEVFESLENLNWAEFHFIREFDAVNSAQFYNISPGGKASLGFTGKKHTEDRNRIVSEKLKGHPVSDKARAAATINGRNNMKTVNATQVVCPHCEKGGMLGPMKRWHFDHCPERETAQSMRS